MPPLMAPPLIQTRQTRLNYLEDNGPFDGAAGGHVDVIGETGGPDLHQRKARTRGLERGGRHARLLNSRMHAYTRMGRESTPS